MMKATDIKEIEAITGAKVVAATKETSSFNSDFVLLDDNGVIRQAFTVRDISGKMCVDVFAAEYDTIAAALAYLNMTDEELAKNIEYINPDNTPSTMNANNIINSLSRFERATYALRWSGSRTYLENGQKFIITAKVELSDDCGNNRFDFSVTCDIKRIAKNGRRVDWGGGCNHELILRYFPKLAPFVALHLASWDGVPTYPVENGYYYAHNGEAGTLESQLNVTPSEAAALRSAPDKAYFKHLLYSLGVVNRWHAKGAAAVAMLENMVGKKFVNPYTPDVELFRLTYTDDERAEIAAKIEAGYYTPVAIEERRKAAEAAKVDAIRAEIIARADKAIKKANDEKNVMLFILDAGLPVDNVIYYDHTNTAEFNWLRHRAMITPADLDKLNAPGLDRSKLPEGIKFIINTENK